MLSSTNILILLAASLMLVGAVHGDEYHNQGRPSVRTARSAEAKNRAVNEGKIAFSKIRYRFVMRTCIT